MGYFKAQTIERIKLPSNPEYWIDVTTGLKWGDSKRFGSVSTDGKIDFETSADLYMAAVIKAWNLDDDNGEILPITTENIDKLEQDDALFIIKTTGAAAEGEDAKKNSPKQ